MVTKTEMQGKLTHHLLLQSQEKRECLLFPLFCQSVKHITTAIEQLEITFVGCERLDCYVLLVQGIFLLWQMLQKVSG